MTSHSFRAPHAAAASPWSVGPRVVHVRGPGAAHLSYPVNRLTRLWTEAGNVVLYATDTDGNSALQGNAGLASLALQAANNFFHGWTLVGVVVDHLPNSPLPPIDVGHAVLKRDGLPSHGAVP